MTEEALAPFRVAQTRRPSGDPEPLPYLHDARDQREGALAITVDVFIRSESMRTSGRPPIRLARCDTRSLYWTVAQLVAHHTSNGCNLRPGDLIGSGTLSGESDESFGSLLELSAGGAFSLPTREMRTYLEDGDEVVLRAHASREGFVSIGFGECRARVLPAN